MLIRRPDLERIVAGELEVAYRRWKPPTVRAGGRLRTALGELAIEAVEPVAVGRLTAAEARAAGYETLAALRAALGKGEGRVYRIRLRFAGADRRAALRKKARLSRTELDELRARLGRMDARSGDGPWTLRVLRAIEGAPAVRAGDLAAELGWETRAFKQRVRRLKELGLTESLEVGYRLSPRGRAALAGGLS